MKRLLFILCILFSCLAYSQTDNNNEKKMLQVMGLIKYYYVDTVNMSKISEKGIETMLKELDPHSAYIPKKEVEKANEPLQGNIEGIGVTFQIMNDTIHIIDVIADGPSDKVGILPGDKIIKVNDTICVGDSINNDWVMSHLRGKKGSKVVVEIRRESKQTPLTFKIIRDKIPLNSIDTWFMIDKEIGYISLRRFSQNSDQEFQKAVADLKKQGMKKLIFDLRSNGGGYLETAKDICDEFLPKDKRIVYTQGVHSPEYELTSTSEGCFEKGDLVILIDEYTASASEITSGAIQDWDRGVIIGRRSFGKGLVQRPMNLLDGSQMRLTTARYYIPSGRCIQKSYKDGTDAYYQDYFKRYQHKEFLTPDSISFPDSLKYKTNKGRIVYGGGGIMPDIFVPIDTTRASDYFINLRSKNIFNNFSLSWSEKNRETMLKKYPTYDDFDKAFDSLNIMNEFEEYATKEGVKKNIIKTDWVNNIVMNYLKDIQKDTTQNSQYTSYSSYADNLLDSNKMIDQIKQKAKEEDLKEQELIKQSNVYIKNNLKGFIARNLYGTKYYYKAVQETDDTLQKAISVLKDTKQYKAILKN
ncbi:MAG: S41 family peptidase [Bacteroidales bacterium]|jgi:carboxyl-terminal processing protease|nr:S41 family peptidase [Bacteroidales bacterium]